MFESLEVISQMFLRLVNLESYVGSCFLEIGDLGALSLKGCKAFLRKHGLRLSGTKMVCIQRINEHWGKWFYPTHELLL